MPQRLQSWPGAQIPVGEETYAPIAAPRLSANDVNNYGWTTPYLHDSFMTFWTGNQLPSTAIMTAPHPYYIRVNEQYSAQRQAGNYGGQLMGIVQTFNLMERMRNAWSAASARMSGTGG